MIRVRNDGIGIAAEQLDRIFDLFVQVDVSLGRSTSGLGIGLTLAKRLAEMHGGTLQVLRPGVGQGSEFVVRLPIVDATPQPAHQRWQWTLRQPRPPCACWWWMTIGTRPRRLRCH